MSLSFTLKIIIGFITFSFLVLVGTLGFIYFDSESAIETKTENPCAPPKPGSIDDLRTGNKKLTFGYTQLVFTPGLSGYNCSVGIKNTQDSVQELVLVSTFLRNSKDNSTYTDIIFEYDTSARILNPTETIVIPVNITAGQIEGNFLYKWEVYTRDGEEYEIYDSRTFFIKVISEEEQKQRENSERVQEQLS